MTIIEESVKFEFEFDQISNFQIFNSSWGVIESVTEANQKFIFFEYDSTSEEKISIIDNLILDGEPVEGGILEFNIEDNDPAIATKVGDDLKIFFLD